ncbi:hypothetical protein H696_01538 [Fonticula alba]|uniref:Uncharacterized protein n=1 Tax=Fonticula alba TaxID=691883 RepID=A0A058ZF73_FONAL|nr:hypothetical protein H696_01538 [Fonticula alba]KCV72132.1 hypothetical protein H696_01538 [Fonticula alba]|eukprot:XP_009493710.1 hypothetical protein H696_01538 [Fonticula alba]
MSAILAGISTALGVHFALKVRQRELAQHGTRSLPVFARNVALFSAATFTAGYFGIKILNKLLMSRHSFKTNDTDSFPSDE